MKSIIHNQPSADSPGTPPPDDPVRIAVWERALKSACAELGLPLPPRDSAR